MSDRYVTGVGKHTLQMLVGLDAQADLEVTHVQPKSTGEVHASALPLAHVNQVPLRIARNLLSAAWALTGHPALTRWCPNSDWVYCPRELFVAPGRSRYALTVHDTWLLEQEKPGWKNTLKWRWLLGRALRRADLVLTVSEFTAERVKALFGTSESKIRVVGNGATHEFFDPPIGQVADIVPSLAGQSYGIAVGGLTRKKGGDHLLALAEELNQRRPELKLLVVGPVEEPFGPSTWSSNLVHVARGLSDGQLACLVSGAEFACPLSRYEGFGITLVEAMAAGTPVVASDIPPHREVAGKAAILRDPADTVALCEAIDGLLGDPAERDRLCVLGRACAAEYTWDNAVARLYDALKEFSR